MEGGKPLVDATFTAHPSNLIIPSDIQNIKIPTSIAAGMLDKRYPKEQVDETEAVLQLKAEKGEGEHEVVRYEGARHGFAIRGSDMEKEEAEMMGQAEEQAIEWFRRIFAVIKY